MDKAFTALKQALKHLGLSDLDAKAYLTIQRSGKMTVSALARSLQVERPTAYAILERLQNIGLMSERRSGDDPKVHVEPPNRVTELLHHNTTQIQKISRKLDEVLPLLMEDYAAKIQEPVIKVLNDGAIPFFSTSELDMENSDKDFIMFGNCDPYFKDLSNAHLDAWVERRNAHNIRTRILTLRSPVMERLRDDCCSTREIRFLPGDEKIRGLFFCLGNNVVIKNPLINREIRIKDSTTSDFFKYIFEKFWVISALNTSA